MIEYSVRLASPEDVPAIKRIADANRKELGFVISARIADDIRHAGVLVAVYREQVVGFVMYRHRKRDTQTTLSAICIDARFRCSGIGTLLINRLRRDCSIVCSDFIQLKCPADLSSNAFYARSGFRLVATEAGKARALNVWRLFLSDADHAADLFRSN